MRTNRFTRWFLTALAALAALGSTMFVGACSAPDEIDAVFGPEATNARAIAQCESGMNPGAVSRTNDHGLFQINIVHAGRFSEVTGQAWSAVYDAHWNTLYAKWLFDQSGWGPWSCRRVLA